MAVGGLGGNGNNGNNDDILKAVCHELRELGWQAAERDDEDFEAVSTKRPRAFAHISPRHLHQFLTGRDRRRIPRAKHFLSPLGTYSPPTLRKGKLGGETGEGGNEEEDHEDDDIVDHATLEHIDALVSFGRKRALEKYHRDIIPDALSKLRASGIKQDVSYFECENLLLRSTPGIRHI